MKFPAGDGVRLDRHHRQSDERTPSPSVDATTPRRGWRWPMQGSTGRRRPSGSATPSRCSSRGCPIPGHTARSGSTSGHRPSAAPRSHPVLPPHRCPRFLRPVHRLPGSTWNSAAVPRPTRWAGSGIAAEPPPHASPVRLRQRRTPRPANPGSRPGQLGRLPCASRMHRRDLLTLGGGHRASLPMGRGHLPASELRQLRVNGWHRRSTTWHDSAGSARPVTGRSAGENRPPLG